MKAQASARVDVPTARHCFVVRTMESNAYVHVFLRRMLGCVQRHEKVNAWLCARRTIDHDLVRVIPDQKEKERNK